MPLHLNKGAIVICNSCCEAPKAVASATGYNKRVFELKLGCWILMKSAFPSAEEIEPVHLTVSSVQGMFKGSSSIQDVIDAAVKHLSPYPISKQEVKGILNDERLKRLLEVVGYELWDRSVFFEPLRRILHVCNEVLRVSKFVSVCRDASMAEEDKLKVIMLVLIVQEDRVR